MNKINVNVIVKFAEVVRKFIFIWHVSLTQSEFFLFFLMSLNEIFKLKIGIFKKPHLTADISPAIVCISVKNCGEHVFNSMNFGCKILVSILNDDVEFCSICTFIGFIWLRLRFFDEMIFEISVEMSNQSKYVCDDCWLYKMRNWESLHGAWQK